MESYQSTVTVLDVWEMFAAQQENTTIDNYHLEGILTHIWCTSMHVLWHDEVVLTYGVEVAEGVLGEF